MDSVNLNLVGQAMAFLMSLSAFVVMLKSLFGAGTKENAAKLGDHEHRLTTLENDVRHLPNKESVHQLQIDLTEMKGQIGIMAKSSEITERGMRRVEEYLFREANK